MHRFHLLNADDWQLILHQSIIYFLPHGKCILLRREPMLTLDVENDVLVNIRSAVRQYIVSPTQRRLNRVQFHPDMLLFPFRPAPDPDPDERDNSSQQSQRSSPFAENMAHVSQTGCTPDWGRTLHSPRTRPLIPGSIQWQ